LIVAGFEAGSRMALKNPALRITSEPASGDSQCVENLEGARQRASLAR
jgi:hypothetical protein